MGGWMDGYLYKNGSDTQNQSFCYLPQHKDFPNPIFVFVSVYIRTELRSYTGGMLHVQNASTAPLINYFFLTTIWPHT